MCIDIIISFPIPEMLILPGRSGARSPEGFLRRTPLARRATVLQVLRMLQVPDRPALHGSAKLPLLLCGVQKENHGLEGQNKSLRLLHNHLWNQDRLSLDQNQSRENKHWCSWMRAEIMHCGCVNRISECLIYLILRCTIIVSPFVFGCSYLTTNGETQYW